MKTKHFVFFSLLAVSVSIAYRTVSTLQYLVTAKTKDKTKAAGKITKRPDIGPLSQANRRTPKRL